jgi:hypothetical protein
MCQHRPLIQDFKHCGNWYDIRGTSKELIKMIAEIYLARLYPPPRLDGPGTRQKSTSLAILVSRKLVKKIMAALQLYAFQRQCGVD